jgi:4-hydroxy-tetrahydrodipicolinate synthase
MANYIIFFKEKKMKIPRGVIPAMLTIFDDSGNFDPSGQKRFIEWLISKGVHGLSPCGSTGEGAAMTDDEKVQVVKTTVEAANGRVPIYPGVIHYSEKLASELVRKYKDLGADGIMVLLPYYYKPTIPSAIDYLRNISKVWGAPIMVYNNPWFAGFELEPEQIKNLADEGVVNSIKAAHGDAMRVNYTKYLCGDKVSCLYGHDYSPLEAFAVGADGWLSGIPNLTPDICVELFNAVDKEKNLEKAQAAWKRMLPIVYYFMYERKGANAAPHWLSVFKDGITMLGENVGKPRAPAVPLTKPELDVMKKYLKQVYPDLVK